MSEEPERAPMTNEWEKRRIPLSRDPLMNDYDRLRKAADYYMIEGNVEALLRISNYSQLIVARAISEGKFTPKFLSSLERDPEGAVKLYRQVRWKLNDQARSMFRRLVAKAVIKISVRGEKGYIAENRKLENSYEPGMDFDVEETIDRLVNSGKELDGVTYEDIVGLDRRKKEYSAVVVIDSSGSMSGHKILSAATIAAIISHKIRRGSYSVIGFNSEAFLIKSAEEKKDPTEVVEDILDLVPLGYTNIADGLSLALEESRSMVRPRFILITDGEHNVGDDPKIVASRVRGLHVIYVGGRGSRKGVSFCRTLAKLGDGKFYELRDPKDIPKLVREILS